jgi:alkyl sulfatase BDS1-like metallo-beta-lactamase superfamily hydrolase
MLSLRTMIDHDKARNLDATVGFTVSGESFVAELKDGRMPVRRAEPGEGAVTFEAPRPLPLLRVFYGKYPLAQVESQGELKVSGDRELARRFVDLFALPEKVG